MRHIKTLAQNNKNVFCLLRLCIVPQKEVFAFVSLHVIKRSLFLDVGDSRLCKCTIIHPASSLLKISFFYPILEKRSKKQILLLVCMLLTDRLSFIMVKRMSARHNESHTDTELSSTLQIFLVTENTFCTN